MRHCGRYSSLNSRIAVAWCLLTACTGTALCQDKPDFSGTWILESPVVPGVDVPVKLTVRQSLVRTNVRGEPMKPYFKTISVQREFATLLRTDSYEIGLIGGFVGGSAGQHADDPSDRPHGSDAVMWFGRQLVFTNARYSGGTKESGPYTEHSERWTLERADKLVTRLSDESSERPRTIVTVTYRKRR